MESPMMKALGSAAGAISSLGAALFSVAKTENYRNEIANTIPNISGLFCFILRSS
jgi:hypothetical protein